MIRQCLSYPIYVGQLVEKSTLLKKDLRNRCNVCAAVVFFEQPLMRIYHCYQISLRLRISVRYQFTTYLPSKNLTFPNRFVRHHFGWPVYKNSGALIGRICLLAMYFNFGFFTFLHNVVGSISNDWQLPWRIQLIRQPLLHF